MVARTRGRLARTMMMALATSGALSVTECYAQLNFGRAKAAKKAEAAPAKGQAATAGKDGDGPRLEFTAIPANPTDAIATVNSQPITRQQLSDECVARQGKEILDTLIARTIIEQALKAQKLEVTSAEIDQEIENVANNVAHVGREAWLRTLDKERGISPVQYARDIIYPALALRKLSASRVQITPEDMRQSFEAQYGEKIRCRLIMVDKMQTAQSIWEELRKNPGGFEKMAQERSMDAGSRSLGGLLAEPISRHAYPQNVSDAAFRQLVDGDPDDKDPTHKPKDGDITGPIQLAESTWIILKREALTPGNKDANPKDERIRKNVYTMIYEVKLKEAMNACFVDLMKAAAIDNKLTGHVKLANEELNPDHQVDGDVQLMSNPAAAIPPTGTAPSQLPASGAPSLGAPAGIAPDAANR